VTTIISDHGLPLISVGREAYRPDVWVAETRDDMERHALTTDVTRTLCGFWLGDRDWHLVSKKPTCETCVKLVAALDEGEPDFQERLAEAICRAECERPDAWLGKYHNVWRAGHREKAAKIRVALIEGLVGAELANR